MFILGLLAFGLNYLNAVPKVLAWIYEWGEETAMWIKIGLMVGDAIICLLGYLAEAGEQAEAEESE